MLTRMMEKVFFFGKARPFHSLFVVVFNFLLYNEPRLRLILRHVLQTIVSLFVITHSSSVDPIRLAPPPGGMG